MMADDIEVLVLNALQPIVENTWSVALPEKPSFPAIVFQIETESEQGWSKCAGYDRHNIQVYVLALTKQEVKTLFNLVRPAMAAVQGYLMDGESGDADFEDEPNAYAYFGDFVIRLPIHIVD